MMQHSSVTLIGGSSPGRPLADILYRRVGGVFLLIALAAVLYIMVNGIGLIDSLDFGAGAYYYADIPNFEKYTDSSTYRSEVSMPVLIALFLLWGALMYRCWKRLL
ncbi:MAG: hypothetical protein IJ056_09295 [Acidaminococcaceae bacterium]|nr:hypothetical protein [Acidaminococcaceae bacterium]